LTDVAQPRVGERFPLRIRAFRRRFPARRRILGARQKNPEPNNDCSLCLQPNYRQERSTDSKLLGPWTSFDDAGGIGHTKRAKLAPDTVDIEV
jgi:hypothetical protein